jgi:hypothetical protein
MATRLCPPGSYVLDSASFVSLQAVRNAVAHPKCDGISLYNGGLYGCTVDHVKIIADSGKCLGPNWERRADEAMHGAGAWAVDSARQGVERWGIDPASVPTILSAVDFSAMSHDWPQLDYWHETACDRADDTDTWIGFYGQTAYGEHLITQPWWTRTTSRPRPTWTWGGSGMITDTNMKQHVGFPSGIDWSSVGVTVDENRVEAGLAMYAADGNQEDTMNGLIIDLRDSWVVFEGIWTGSRVVGPIAWIDGTTRADRLAAGFDNISRSWRELKGMVYLGSVLPQGDGHPQAPSVNWDGSQFRDWITRGTTPTPVLVPHTHDGGRSGPAIAG